MACQLNKCSSQKALIPLVCWPYGCLAVSAVSFCVGGRVILTAWTALVRPSPRAATWMSLPSLQPYCRLFIEGEYVSVTLGWDTTEVQIDA